MSIRWGHLLHESVVQGGSAARDGRDFDHRRRGGAVYVSEILSEGALHPSQLRPDKSLNDTLGLCRNQRGSLTENPKRRTPCSPLRWTRLVKIKGSVLSPCILEGS